PSGRTALAAARHLRRADRPVPATGPCPGSTWNDRPANRHSPEIHSLLRCPPIRPRYSGTGAGTMTARTTPRLGKGLDALFSNPMLAEPPGPPLAPTQVAIDRIDQNPHQPRKRFDDEELAALTESIMEHGLLQPLLVRQVGDRYQLIAG